MPIFVERNIQAPERTSAAPTIKSALRLLATLLIPLIGVLTTEWIHRGSLATTFPQALKNHTAAYVLAWAFLLLVYTAVSRLTGLHNLATLLVGVLGNVPAAITYFKLQLRGEPFLPWDISQAWEASNVMGKANLEMQSSMGWSIAIFIVLFVLTTFLGGPRRRDGKRVWWMRIGVGAAAAALLGGLIGGVYLRPTATTRLKIYPDMWMQNRYYRNYGVITGFLSNLQSLNIAEPSGYNKKTMEALQAQIRENTPQEPLYPESHAAAVKNPVQTPNIIYVMGEAFWDVTELEGITFGEDITPNLHRMKEQAAVGNSYSPSFGGGTCDVEFEALTGYSMEHLPNGSKPYQQHVTKEMFALPAYLKSLGYDTMAIHGYYKKYWNRDKAYPNLGIDRFIAAEDFVNPEKKRSFYWKGGLISDAEMGRRIISEYENREPGKPLFVHAVTMQNHSSYNIGNYPEEELVTITGAPEGISQESLNQLRDYATGIKENDALLGQLVDYFSQVQEPTILVFWGDHYNTVGKGYEIYEKTGYIEPGDAKSPRLHGTPLVIWSNYDQKPVDLGVVAAYDISPVMMDLYGLKKPPLFDFLTQALSVFRARTRGVTINPDGTSSEEMTQEQQEWFDRHWLLQYDLMFGNRYSLENGME